MATQIGYNPQPHKPDPFEVAFRLGYSVDPDGWDIGTALQRASQINSAHREEIDAAHVERYGAGWDTPGPLGAEHATNIWPRVLQALYGGFPSLREVHDATWFGTKAMVVEAFVRLRVQGYTQENPIEITPGDPVWGALLGSPDPLPGLYRVPAKAAKGDPHWFDNYRDSQWGGDLYYRVVSRPGSMAPQGRPSAAPATAQANPVRSGLPNELLEEASRVKREMEAAGILSRGGGRWAQALRRLLRLIGD